MVVLGFRWRRGVREEEERAGEGGETRTAVARGSVRLSDDVQRSRWRQSEMVVSEGVAGDGGAVPSLIFYFLLFLLFRLMLLVLLVWVVWVWFNVVGVFVV
ncbi:hypothetical protein RJT34_11987 [Clitoria ternatea]|uniref:Transmembrane protein n=1 Tax=Clitoria ternatea TaxID=43366 RepID=A0AAN9JN19_CLITE